MLLCGAISITRIKHSLIGISHQHVLSYNSIFAYVFKNPQILMTLGLVVMFVLYMFCGVFISIDQMPQLFRNISSYLPIKYAMNDFFDIWTMEKFLDKDFLLISAVYLVISTIVLGICIIRENKRFIYSGGKNNEK